jgi:hypothetical protein
MGVEAAPGVDRYRSASGSPKEAVSLIETRPREAPAQQKEGTMQKTQRLGFLFVSMVGLVLALTAPASAATRQISGVGVFGDPCPPAPPVGFEDFNSYPPIAMTGSLEGCWYTKVVSSHDNGAPSGVYIERGEEVFIGSLHGGPVGTFTTTYLFTSKWAPDVSTGSEVHGRCQHPIVAGSGTGGFLGATGRLDFKDDVETGEYFYRGHIKGWGD